MIGYADTADTPDTASTPTTMTALLESDLPFKQAKRILIETFERRYIGALITRCGGNLSAASRRAKLSRRHLRDLLRRHDLYRAPANAEQGVAR